MKFKDVVKTFEDYDFITVVDNDDDVIKSTFERIGEYKLIAEKCSKQYGEIIEAIKIELEDIMNQTMNGMYHKAHSQLRNMLFQYKDLLYIHNLDSENGISINIYDSSNMHLYKGRVLDWGETIDRTDIFHIPFNRREFVSTQRFSINGVPCIYLGQSLHVVWEELNRPHLNNLFVSRFEIDQDLTVLDIGLNNSDIAQFAKYVGSELCEFDRSKRKSDDSISEIAEKFIITNVLKIACSILVRKQERKFKSEYVFPQLLMSVITDSKIADGIRYSSVKINSDSYIHANYAFPCLQELNERHSKYFSRKMKLTQPINLGLYQIANVRNSHSSYFPENMYRSHTHFQINENYRILYQDTEFYKIEQQMFSDPKLTVGEIS